MRRILLIACCLAVCGVLAFIALSMYEDVERLETRLGGNIKTGHIDRLWFSPGGELVGIDLNESQLIVRVWSGIGALVRERTVSLPGNGPAEPIFAVSGDASQAAWIERAGVRVVSLISPKEEKPDELRSSRSVPISSLAFTGSGKLAALYQDGELEIRDIGGDRVTAATHLDIGGPGLLISSGSHLAAYSGASGAAFVFETAGDRFALIEYKKYPRDILSLTLSPQAKFAVATRETIEQPGLSISVPGPVRSFAFVDRNRVLAAGDFEGIYLLGPNQGPQRVAGAKPGTTVLAADKSNFAFGDGGSLTLASVRMVRGRVYKGTSRPSTWLLIALFGLLSPVAIYFLYGSLNLIFRKARSPLSEPQAPEKPPEEGSIPNALIEACRNGDCVLWAGSGLGAQAGLPTWSAFLRELVDWAARNGAAPIGVNEEAADRIAAAFENREQTLHAYLRQRFRVSSELSQAHHLVKEIDFPALVTTSLDNLLDRAFPYSGGRVYTAAKCEELVRAAGRRDFYLLKPFGDPDEPDTLRIGPSQCAEVIRSNAAVSELMEKLFETRVFLFLGASLEGLDRDLAMLNLPAPTARKHYALVPITGEGWEVGAERLRQRYAIEPLTYSPSTAQHSEVVDFLTKLIGLIRQTAAPEYFEDPK